MAGRYAERGVSADKEDVHAAVASVDKGLFPGAFCKIVADEFSREHGLVMHADGAGTKSSLAYMLWRETGDLAVWEGIAQDAIVMNIDDLLCVGATSARMLVSSTIGRNKNLVPGEVVSALINGTERFLAKMRALGVDAVLTGGETADVGDLVRTVIVDSTVISRIPLADVIDNSRIAEGDVIIGLASFGQATYESEYNSGMGSNGLTSARHDVFSKSLAEKFPESFDPLTPRDLVYSGKYGLLDPIQIDNKGTCVPAGKLVLSPTRTYAPVILKVLEKVDRAKIHGMVHCSGGAQTKILHFLQNGLHAIKDNLFEVPPLFRVIQGCSGTDWKEMYKVFNMGHRMELYVSSEVAQSIIEVSQSFKIEAQIVGKVVKGDDAKTAKLTIDSPFGKFDFRKP